MVKKSSGTIREIMSTRHSSLLDTLGVKSHSPPKPTSMLTTTGGITLTLQSRKARTVTFQSVSESFLNVTIDTRKERETKRTRTVDAQRQMKRVRDCQARDANTNRHTG